MAKNKTFVGLDFGTYSIKAVWASVGEGGVSFPRAEELQIPPETQDPVRFLTPWLEKQGLPKALCATALPGAQVVFQSVLLPPEDPRTPEEAAETESASFSEMAAESMEYGLSSTTQKDGSRRMLLGMVRPGIIGQGLDSAEMFGLRLCELAPSPVALYNGLVQNLLPGEGAALFVSIGHGSTDVAVGTAEGLLFSRTFAVGGKSFSDAVARSAKVSELQAERLKKTEGSLVPGTPQEGALRPVANLWISQLKSSISVYRGQFKDAGMEIRRVLLAGGGARLDGLDRLVSDELGLPVAIPEAGSGLPVGGPAFATACGLALSAVERMACPLSLFPKSLKNEIVFREKKPWWIAAGIAAVLALGLFIVHAVRGISRERAEVAEETARIQLLQKINSSYEALRSAEEETRGLAAPVRKLLEGGPTAREVVRLIANSIHPDDWITLFCDEASYVPDEVLLAEKDKEMSKVKSRFGAGPLRIAAPTVKKPAPAQPPKPIAKKGRKGAKGPETPAPAAKAKPAAPETFSAFIVEGYTPYLDLRTVRDLVNRLRESPLVHWADVLHDDKVLPAPILGDVEITESMVGGLSRFVLRIEVEPMTDGSDSARK